MAEIVDIDGYRQIRELLGYLKILEQYAPKDFAFNVAVIEATASYPPHLRGQLVALLATLNAAKGKRQKAAARQKVEEWLATHKPTIQ